MSSALNNAHSWLASAFRVPNGGWFVNGALREPPVEPLHLYEFEACPFCRKVREALSVLDISYVCHPCAKGSNNRAFVMERGKKALFPFLVDPNTDTAMYESEDIIDYLYTTYGAGRPGMQRALAPLNTLASAMASVVRRRGGRVRAGCEDRKQPEQPLELWHFEISPYSRKARETLAELNLDHRVHNVAKNGRRRAELVALGGKMMVPYLVDPNTGVAMYESDDIVAYLNTTYG